MKRAIAMVCVLAMVAPVAADPRKVVVMQSEGRADAATRAKIDAAVLKLARTSDPQATASDITYSDAAAAVGCKPEEKTCKDEVLGMLAIDELVYTTVVPKPGGLEIDVHRVTKGSATREAQMILPTGQAPDKLDGIAPLFGGDRPATATSTSSPTETRPTETRPTETEPGPTGAPATEPSSSVVTTPPPGPSSPVDEGASTDRFAKRRRLELVGMIGGGSFVVLSFLLWGEANSIDGEIAKAPTRTRADLQHIQDLESRGDSYAKWGNVLFLTGAVVGGVSAYFFWKDRKAQRARTASLAPAVFDHGAGLVLTIGGSP